MPNCPAVCGIKPCLAISWLQGFGVQVRCSVTAFDILYLNHERRFNELWVSTSFKV